MNAGCNAHITKPFSKVKLLDAILKQTKGDNCVNESNLNKENQKTIVHVSPYIQKLMPEFLKDKEKAYNLILGALERGDYKTINFLGHSMKDAGRGYGIEGISGIGESLIIAANNERYENIKNKAIEFSKYILQIEVV